MTGYGADGEAQLLEIDDQGCDVAAATAGFYTLAASCFSTSPGAFLQEALRRFDAFNLTNSDAAKVLLIDALFIEVVPSYSQLRVWKAAPLESDTRIGVADYLIAPKRAYLATPLLCAVEAKRDDFEQGRAQCLAEMAACQWNNLQESHSTDVFGVVSNGQAWQFYRLTQVNEIYESGLFTTDDLLELLGVLDYMCAECASVVV